MRLSPDRSDAVSAAIREVCRKAQDASLASDTDAARKRLNDVWFAIHEAQRLLADAEKATRDEALAQIEGKAA